MTNYPYIAAWGVLTGATPGYTGEQVKRAQETNAPPTAVYEIWDGQVRTGQWRLAEDINPPARRRRLRAMVKS